VPFNLLLIPLAAAFLFLDGAHLFSYSTSLLQKEQLLLRASVVGLGLAITSRLICWILVQTLAGLWLQSVLYHLAPFPFIGTALGTLVLGGFARGFVNFVVPRNVAGEWLYHAELLNPMESTLLRSAMGTAPTGLIPMRTLLRLQIIDIFKAMSLTRLRGHRRTYIARLKISTRKARSLSGFPFGDPEAVMVTKTDGKVYVGIVENLPPVSQKDLEYVNLLPIWSGYRKSETHEVRKVTSYADALRKQGDWTKLQKVLRCSDIATVSIFEDDLFQIPSDREPGGETNTSRGGVDI